MSKMTDKSSEEPSPSDSGLEYEPSESSVSVIESEEETVPPKRTRCSKDQATTNSTVHPNGKSANTNGARLLDKRPRTSTEVLECLIRPQEFGPKHPQMHLQTDYGCLPAHDQLQSPHTVQPGVQANTFIFPDNLLQLIVDQTNLFAQQYIAKKKLFMLCLTVLMETSQSAGVQIFFLT